MGLLEPIAYISLQRTDANVKCKDAVVYVSVESDLSLEMKMSDQIKVLLENIGEIKEVKAGVIPLGTD